MSGRGFLLGALVFLCCVAAAQALSAEEYNFVEDFTTLDHCDTLSTTAIWDTAAGRIQPYPFQLLLAGYCDTPVNAEDVAISGNYAYVADKAGGMI